jgi:hypothetical protein
MGFFQRQYDGGRFTLSPAKKFVLLIYDIQQVQYATYWKFVFVLPSNLIF